MNYHVVYYSRTSNGHVLYEGNQSTGKHVSFPDRLWASGQFHSDPRDGTEVFLHAIEPCECHEDTRISASEYMSIRRPIKWAPSATQPEPPKPKIDWSGQRQPVLTREQRAQLQP